MIYKITLILISSLFLYSCGKIGPLALPEDQINKSVISYPCDEDCVERFEKEKLRQQSVILQAD